MQWKIRTTTNSYIRRVRHSLQDGSVNRTIYMSAQSLSLSVKMFLHHCQSSLGTIRNIPKTVFPDKTKVLNAALQLVDPYIFTLPSDSSCFYICVIIRCAKINLFLRHPQNKCKIKAHTHTHAAHAHVSLERLGYRLVHST